MTYSRPMPTPLTLRRERIHDRRILNCVDNPRVVFNVTTVNSPASVDEDYLLRWIAEKPPLTSYEAVKLLDQRKPLFMIDAVDKRPMGFLDYSQVNSQDVIAIWDWSRTWSKKSGEKLKTPSPALKKVIQVEGRGLQRRDGGNIGDLILPFDAAMTRALVS